MSRQLGQKVKHNPKIISSKYCFLRIILQFRSEIIRLNNLILILTFSLNVDILLHSEMKVFVVWRIGVFFTKEPN